MKIYIEELIREENKQFKIDKIFNGFAFNDYQILSPIAVLGMISYADNILLIDLNVSYSYVASCGRCLAEVNSAKKLTINDKLFKEELFGIFGEYFDLEEFVKDSIISDMPAKILCRDDCRGLCPECGKNLNEASCDCSKEKYNPQFAELLSLLDGESKN